MANISDPVMEKRFVAALIADPEKMQEYPDAQNILTDKLSISAMKAVAAGARDPMTIATVMSKNGAPGMTVEALDEGLLKYGKGDFRMESLDFAYNMLQNMYAAREAAPIFQAAANSVIAGKKLDDALAELEAKIAGIPYLQTTVPTVTTDQWTPKNVRLENEKLRQTYRKGQSCTLPYRYPILRDRVPILYGRVIGLIMDTGAGKTILAADIIPHHWASQGRKVCVFLTETSLIEIRNRHIIRTYSEAHPGETPISLPWLEAGNWDERCDEALPVYKNGGMVEYIDASGGMTLSTALALAKRRGNADVVFDLWHGIRIPSDARERDDVRNENALAGLSSYCKKTGANAIFTTQMLAEARRSFRNGSQQIDPSQVRGGSTYEDKADIYYAGAFKKLQEDTVIKHPVSGRNITFPAQAMSPIGRIRVAKGRTGGAGYSQLVWREGEIYTIWGIMPESARKKYGDHRGLIYVPDNMITYYQEIIR